MRKMISGLCSDCGGWLPSAAHADAAVLAGGCFWGMEAVFEHVKGVTRRRLGLCRRRRDATPITTRSARTTGHAEAVRITYDPGADQLRQLLQIYFTVAHDPTQVNRQGPDIGPSYRSAIFPQSAATGANRESVHRAG